MHRLVDPEVDILKLSTAKLFFKKIAFAFGGIQICETSSKQQLDFSRVGIQIHRQVSTFYHIFTIQHVNNFDT
jgi:hypothetical protein